MSWRTVVIASRCKLDYKMGFMVVRAEETKKIFLDEIYANFDLYLLYLYDIIVLDTSYYTTFGNS